MSRTNEPSLDDLATLGPPEGTPEHSRYLRYVALSTRLTTRLGELRQQLARLQPDIADKIAVGSPEALVLAAKGAEQLAHDATDTAQLKVLGEHVSLRLEALRHPTAQ